MNLTGKMKLVDFHKRLITSLISTALAFGSVSPLAAWSASVQECVGRYVLNLPGPAESALNAPKSLLEPDEHPIKFSDGKIAPYSLFSYNGGISVTPHVSEADFERLKIRLSTLGKDIQSNELRWNPKMQSSVGWSTGHAAGFATYQDGRIFDYSYTQNETLPDAMRTASAVAEGFRTRKFGEIPGGLGVCLPFAFIADAGNDIYRLIGVSFRLLDHPDVTITFQDFKVWPQDPKLTSKQENQFLLGYGLAVGTQFKFHGVPYLPQIIDGRIGTVSSGTITRFDGSKDFAYLANAEGNATAKSDAPTLVIFVEQNTKEADGHPPVTLKEIQKIGDTIVRSVRRFPVK